MEAKTVATSRFLSATFDSKLVCRTPRSFFNDKLQGLMNYTYRGTWNRTTECLCFVRHCAETVASQSENTKENAMHL